MKRTTFYIAIIYLSIGCKAKSVTESNFEQNLPKEDLVVLNKIVIKLDELVDNKFEGHVSVFLSKIAKGERVFEDKDSISNGRLIKQFEKSTLDYRIKKMLYDTVFSSNYYNWELGDNRSYSQDPAVITVTQEGDASWQNVIIPGVQTIEKQIEYVRNEGYWLRLSNSSFIEALNIVKLEDITIAEYVDAKLAVGELSHVLIVKTILQNNIDADNYFMRRILAFEVFRNQMKKEYGC